MSISSKVVGTKRGANGACGSLMLVIFGLVFGGLGGTGLYFFWKDYQNKSAQLEWPRVPCEIKRLEITYPQIPTDNPFRMQAEYVYRAAGGTTLTGTTVGLGDSGTDNYLELAMARDQIFKEKLAAYDPDNPAASVLVPGAHRSFWPIYLIAIFPIVGIIIVLSGLAGVVKGLLGPKKQSLSTRAISKARGGLVFGIILFAVFFIVGTGLFWKMFFGAAHDEAEARKWQEAPCEMIWSRVKTSTSTSKGKTSATYGVDAFYKYEWTGREYKSNRYSLDTSTSSGLDSKQKVVDTIRGGSRQICYVNPQNPHEAVLNRSVGIIKWLAFLPLIFALVGLLGLLGCLKSLLSKSKGGAANRQATTAGPMEMGDLSSAMNFHPAKGRRGAVVGLGIFALIWNAITGAITYGMSTANDTPIFAWLLMGVFGLVGVGAVWMFVAAILKLFSPVTELVVHGRRCTGGTLDVSWATSRNAGKMESLTITLLGREEATYRRGTNTVTDRHVFAKYILLQTANRSEMIQGRLQFPLPMDSVPTMTLANNKIIWEIVVTAAIPNWPDVEDKYPVAIFPQPTT